MKKFFAALLSIAMLVATCDSLYARGGSSFGGSRSSGSRSSSSGWSKPSSSKPSSSSSWGSKSSSSKPTTPSKPSVGSSKSKEAVQSNGKTFSSKAEATAQFKKDNAAKYTAKFDKEPSSRPSYIPQSTKVGNQNVNVTYNNTYGGYGYMHPTLGTWMMYDAMTDAVMLSALMNQNHYTVAQPTTGTSVVVVKNSNYWLAIGLIVTVVLVFVVIGCIVVANKGLD